MSAAEVEPTLPTVEEAVANVRRMSIDNQILVLEDLYGFDDLVADLQKIGRLGDVFSLAAHQHDADWLRTLLANEAANQTVEGWS